MRQDLPRKLAVTTGALLAVLAVAVWVHWRNTALMDATADWVAHTREVIGVAEHVLRLNVDMETGLRGYVITADDTYLEPLEKGHQELPPALALLEDLTRDNPPQHERVLALRGHVDEHIQFRVGTAELVRSVGWEAARQQLHPVEGRRRLEEIRAAAAAVIDTEQMLLRQRARRRTRRPRAAN